MMLILTAVNLHIPKSDVHFEAQCLRHQDQERSARRHLLRPKKGAREPMMPILTAMRPTRRDSTMFHSCSSRLTSMLAPVVTKKRPSSMPRNGRMSASTYECISSVSCVQGPSYSSRGRLES